MGVQVTQFNPQSGVVTGGYSTPYTVSFPIRDLSGRQGLFLFTNEEDSHFQYSAPPWGAGIIEPNALFQYVGLRSGTPLSLEGIEFPFTANRAAPVQTPLVRWLDYTHDNAIWTGLFATDSAGNYYIAPTPIINEPLGDLVVVHSDGTFAPYPWAPYGSVLQLLWQSNSLYTVERTMQGTGVTSTFTDIIRQYSTGGQFSGRPYAQVHALPVPGGAPETLLPIPPGLLLDISSAGNVYVVDLSNLTVNGCAPGATSATLFTTVLPSGATPLAMCLCEALGYVAVLCSSGTGTETGAAAGNDNGLQVWNAQPPYTACQLYLYHMTTGAQITPSWGTTLPFTLQACPEYNGLLFDGSGTLLVVDKFNGASASGGVQQLAACLDPYATLHVASVSGGNIQYAQTNPADGPLSPEVVLGEGSAPSLLWTGNRLRATYEGGAGDYTVRYSADGGVSWGVQ